MLDYIIKVLLFQTLFLAVYDLLLKRETFFQWNRAYLILTSFLAYIIPIVKFESVQKIVPQEYIVYLPEVMLSPTTTIEQIFDWSSLLFTTLQYIFWIGIMTASLLFLVKLFKIVKLISNNEKENKGNYLLVFLEKNTAFSFFNYIFLGKTNVNQNRKQIIEHELVHVQQKHSLDLLFFELQRIVCWFNPFSYVYQNRISELHEFIADSKAIKQNDKTTYFNNLLAETFGVQKISFINPFFKHSLIKKRIIMLGKNKSKQFLKLKYLLLIPVLVSMLVYTSCERTETEIQKDTSVKELIGELNAKMEENKVSEEDIKLLIDLLSKTHANYDGDKIKKERMLLLLKEKVLREVLEKNYSNVEEVPFAVIGKSPIFSGCEDDKYPKKCLQESISKHVTNNFNISLAQSLGLDPGTKRVYVMFTIDKNGNITKVRARGPHKSLEEEALRVIKTLPQMIPGEHNGKKVNVKYTLPITFKVD